MPFADRSAGGAGSRSGLGRMVQPARPCNRFHRLSAGSADRLGGRDGRLSTSAHWLALRSRAKIQCRIQHFDAQHASDDRVSSLMMGDGLFASADGTHDSPVDLVQPFQAKIASSCLAGFITRAGKLPMLRFVSFGGDLKELPR